MAQQDSSVNPYQLLGLDYNTCTEQDVRRAFRGLALLAHPDKGGRADDMRVIQTAYAWIMQQLSIVKEKGTETFEEKETSFKEFLESQQEIKIMPLNDVMANSIGFTEAMFETYFLKHCQHYHDARPFVRAYVESVLHSMFISRSMDTQSVEECLDKEIRLFFERYTGDQNCMKMAHDDGYGQYMEPSAVGADVDKPLTHDFSSLQKKESRSHANYAMIHIDDSDDDEPNFTYNNMCDYMEAHSGNYEPFKDAEEKLPSTADPSNVMMDALERLKAMRQLQDTEISQANQLMMSHKITFPKA